MELGSRQEGDASFLFGRNLSGTLEKLNKSVKNLVRYVAEHENGIMDAQELISRISGALKVGHFFMRQLPRTYRDAGGYQNDGQHMVTEHAC